MYLYIDVWTCIVFKCCQNITLTVKWLETPIYVSFHPLLTNAGAENANLLISTSSDVREANLDGSNDKGVSTSEATSESNG